MSDVTQDKSAFVSCQVLGQIFVACDQKGVDIDDVLVGVPYSREFIETPSNFIDWSSLVRLLNQVTAHFTDEEVLEISAVSYEQPLFVVYKLIGRLRYDLRSFYHYLFGTEGLVTRFYPMTSEVLDDDHVSRNLTFRITTLEGLEPCEPFFRVLEGQARGISEVMGYGRSEVMATYLEHGIELSIGLPREKGVLSFFRRILTNPLSLIRISRILQETQDTLVERNRQLTAETRQLIAAQKTLKRQQEQLNVLADNTPILLWSVDMDFKILYCSPSVETLLGYSQEETLNMTVLSMIDADSRETMQRMFSKQMPEEGPGENTYDSRALRLRHQRKDGSAFWSENYLSFTRDPMGRPTGVVGASIDIDNQINRDIREAQLEDELNRARRQELVGRVAGGIAHDFNNSLQIIIGFAELSTILLKSGNLNQTNEYQNLILQSANSASELVKQLLAFSRRQTLTMRPTNIADWLRQTKPLLASMMGANTEIVLSLEENLVVMADPIELERVIINLILNSGEAMPDGGSIRISLTACLTDNLPESLKSTGDRYLQLMVSDTGHGVPADHLDNIFDLYYTTKEADSNSGLGLAVSAGIIEQHGGQIHARGNSDGEGVSIDVLLPLTDKPVEAETVTEGLASLPLNDQSILVVDDQRVILDLVAAILRGEGAKVIVAQDGEEAVSLVKKGNESFDLVVTDIVMPKMNGDVAARQIREISPDTRILFMTGYAGDRTVVDSLSQEIVLTKPFSRKSLLAVIREMLSIN